MERTPDLVLSLLVILICALVYIIVQMFINLIKDRDLLDGIFGWKKKD